MRILAISDKRPAIDIMTFVNEQRPDIIVTLGDLTLEDIYQLKGVTSIPKVGVYGNHCSGTYMEALGITNVHCRLWNFNGVTFGGFQGCVRYKDNPQAIMYTQAEANILMRSFPQVDIFLSHCPPYGINDDPNELAHEGFKALRTYLDTQPPKAWLHGHTYPDPAHEMHQYHQTRIEYVSGYKLITL